MCGEAIDTCGEAIRTCGEAIRHFRVPSASWSATVAAQDLFENFLITDYPDY